METRQDRETEMMPMNITEVNAYIDRIADILEALGFTEPAEIVRSKKIK